MTIATPMTPAASRGLITAADLPELRRKLGEIPPERLILVPPPGTATEADLVRLVDGDHKVLCELVDGTLVEKTVGFLEAFFATVIATQLEAYVSKRKLGIVVGADAMMRMTGGNVRMPDVSFIAWTDLPAGKVPTEPVGAFAPTLAVEVLSASNTKAEMHRKREEYFLSGSRLVWEFDIKSREVEVFTAPDRATALRAGNVLDGGSVLPGFSAPLDDLFAKLDQKP